MIKIRIKKSILNASVNIISLIFTLIPNLIVRKVFLESLGSDMLGLTSLYSNIIGWLSIFEMGIGSAIIFSLYKPYIEDDKSKIRAYISYYGKFYRGIGIIILLGSIIVSPFIKYFISNDINYNLASYGLILFSLNTFITYIFSHRLCILNVSQNGYIITIGITISKLIISILQFIMLKNIPNFYLYIFIQIIINLIYYIAINIYISKKFNWINVCKEKLDQEEKLDLSKNIKALFVHKIGSIVVFSTDNIIISRYIGLTMLSKYTNYQIIINALQSIITSLFNGLAASVGNLIASESNEKSYDTFKKLFFINFWIASFIVISLYNTLNQFIVVWVGKENVIDSLSFYVILINIYFVTMRSSIEQFKIGSGNFYQDRYAPLIESIINLVISVFLVKKIGLAGVFIGTLISNFTVVFWTKPYIVYKNVFNKNVNDYFKVYFQYIGISCIPLIITSFITYKFKYNYDMINFMINCILNIFIINITYVIVFYKTSEFKYFVSIFKNMIKISKI